MLEEVCGMVVKVLSKMMDFIKFGSEKSEFWRWIYKRDYG